jgi:hypothetical protein
LPQTIISSTYETKWQQKYFGVELKGALVMRNALLKIKHSEINPININGNLSKKYSDL